MKRKVIALVLILACGVLAFLLWPAPSYKQTLPDGTTLVLSGVKVGPSNVYSHGTVLSKVLGPLAPSNAVNVAGLKLQRPKTLVMPGPDGIDILTAELWLAPGSPRETNFTSPPFSRKHRLLISGDDDERFAFVKDINDMRRHADGLSTLLWAWSYPRDARLLRLRLQERDTGTSRDWREVATFDVDNPKCARVEPWKAERTPRLKLAEGLEVEVGELSVRREPINTNDIWDFTAFLPVRVSRNGQVMTNWGIYDGNVWDASGNYDRFTYSFTRLTNGWTEYRLFRPLDPAKVWKFKVGFGCNAAIPATNLFSFTATWPWPGPIHTNFAGTPVVIDFTRTDMLSVELTNKPAHLRVNFFKAVDDAGTDLDRRSGSWTQHGFWKWLNLPGPATSKPARIHVTVAIHENYEAEFKIQPSFGETPRP